MIDISKCKKYKVVDTCHSNSKTSCYEVCRTCDCYWGDKINKEFKEFKNKASFDCILLNSKNQYIFIDFKDIKVFKDKENILENIKKKYDSSKLIFNTDKVGDTVVVFVGEIDKKFLINKIITSYVNKNNPLKLKDGNQVKVVYRFCKNNNKDMSFEEYLKQIK